MLKISSRDNPKIKSAKRVRDGAVDDLIFVEGLRLAEEFSRSDLRISEVFCTADFAGSTRGDELLQTIETGKCYEVSAKIFDTLAATKNSQGVIIIGEKPFTNRENFTDLLSKKSSNALLVALHQVNNPSNLGAILRTCEAADAAGVIITNRSANAFSPNALRGAMGASMRLPLWTNADFTEILDWAKSRGRTSVCADVNAQKSYTEIDWNKPRLLIFGSEAHGLSREEFERIDESLLIPMANNVESLNLAVAAGVILFEAARQFTK